MHVKGRKVAGGTSCREACWSQSCLIFIQTTSLRRKRQNTSCTPRIWLSPHKDLRGDRAEARIRIKYHVDVLENQLADAKPLKDLGQRVPPPHLADQPVSLRENTLEGGHKEQYLEKTDKPSAHPGRVGVGLNDTYRHECHTISQILPSSMLQQEFNERFKQTIAISLFDLHHGLRRLIEAPITYPSFGLTTCELLSIGWWYLVQFRDLENVEPHQGWRHLGVGQPD
ncbi:hypothetical protein Trydic_g4823 [Trypoxylus dichotomus]